MNYIVIKQPIPQGYHIAVYDNLTDAVNGVNSMECTIHSVPSDFCYDPGMLTEYVFAQLAAGECQKVSEILGGVQ